MNKIVKIVTFVPKTHADIVRQAIGQAGAGKIGNYDFNSFTLVGKGRWRNLEGANPYIGNDNLHNSEKIIARINFI